MPDFQVRYTYAPAEAALRDEHRPAHRAFLDARNAAGEVLLVGPYVDGSGALLIVRADDESAAHAILAQDPFARVGAIADVEVTQWTQVYGPFPPA